MNYFRDYKMFISVQLKYHKIFYAPKIGYFIREIDHYRGLT